MSASIHVILRFVGATALASLLALAAGCGTSAKVGTAPKPEVSVARPFTDVQVILSAEARARFEDEAKGFDIDALSAVVRQRLDAERMFSEQERPDGLRATITVTNLRFRGPIAARMLGFLAGLDEIAADVVVQPAASPAGEYRFSMVTTHGGGGYLYGSVERRLDAMYTSFADKFIEVLRAPAGSK